MTCRSGRVVLCLVSALCVSAVRADIPLDDDGFKVPFYTGKVFPTPQEARYSETFASLADCGLLLGNGIAQDDPRVKVLTDRITQYGGKTRIVKALSDSGGTLILLGETDAASGLTTGAPVPEKPEGYRIHGATQNGRAIILLRGRDRMGLLWAITSFNQLITRKDGTAVAQRAEIVDYPSLPNRSYLTTGLDRVAPDPNASRLCAETAAWLAPRFKMNRVYYHIGILVNRRGPYTDWRLPSPDFVKEDIRRTGAILSPLGIEWYAAVNPGEEIRCKNDDDYRAMLAHARLVASAGGHFAYFQDDSRFPLNADDQRDFGNAREADIYFIQRLYNGLRAEYPAAKLLFCPPFYWGPDGSHTYPESREEYLGALGLRLPREIGIVWTGPRVKSGDVEREQVQWITNLIRRKPVYSQNTFGAPHLAGFHYATDPLPIWTERYYDGFWQDIDTYTLNSDPGAVIATLTLADYMWNPKAYNPEKSVEEACKMLCGPESWPGLVELNQRLSAFDSYGARLTPIAAKHLPELEADLKTVDAALDKAMAHHPQAVSRWTSMAWYVQIQKTWVESVRRNPDLAVFSTQANELKKIAEKEVPLAPATDTFLSAYDFLGGLPPVLYGFRCEKRLTTCVYGARTANGAMNASFECDPFPPAGDYQLILSGQDDDSDKACRIRILVNDQKLFEGDNGFVKRGWSRRVFTVPGATLKRYNTLTIQNIENTDRFGGPPFFLLNYAVLRKPL